MATAIELFHYPKCSTCRKAIKWLEAEGIAFRAVNLADAPPSPARLHELVARSGKPIKAFFNTSGRSYRAGGFKDRLPAMATDESIEALAADGMLIKRPLLATDAAVLVGFREPEWAAAFA